MAIMDVPGRLSYSRAAEAVADFILGRGNYDWPALEKLGALIMERWYADHPPLSRRERLTRCALLAPLVSLVPLLALLALLNLLALRAASPEPEPGRADNAVVRVPSAPLVRAHAILTAAPPSSRAPVLAGAPA